MAPSSSPLRSDPPRSQPDPTATLVKGWDSTEVAAGTEPLRRRGARLDGDAALPCSDPILPPIFDLLSSHFTFPSLMCALSFLFFLPHAASGNIHHQRRTSLFFELAPSGTAWPLLPECRCSAAASQAVRNSSCGRRTSMTGHLRRAQAPASPDAPRRLLQHQVLRRCSEEQQLRTTYDHDRPFPASSSPYMTRRTTCAAATSSSTMLVGTFNNIPLLHWLVVSH